MRPAFVALIEAAKWKAVRSTLSATAQGKLSKMSQIARAGMDDFKNPVASTEMWGKYSRTGINELPLRANRGGAYDIPKFTGKKSNKYYHFRSKAVKRFMVSKKNPSG